MDVGSSHNVMQLQDSMWTDMYAFEMATNFMSKYVVSSAHAELEYGGITGDRDVWACRQFACVSATNAFVSRWAYAGHIVFMPINMVVIDQLWDIFKGDEFTMALPVQSAAGSSLDSRIM